MTQFLNSKTLFFAVAVLVAVLAAWYGLAGSLSPNGSFETKVVDQGPIERIVSASGPVNAVVTVQVGSQVSGQISVLDVDYNARVKKGQRLALIDPQSFQSRVSQAQSDLAAARTQRALQAANVGRAQAQLLKEQRALARLETLSAKGFASPAQLDAQKAVIASAQADVSVARAQVENSQANIAAKEAALAQAKIDLSRTAILSPIEGIVIERNVDRGQTVAASLQAPVLFKIAQDLARVQIEAQVDEADIGGVKQGQSVTFAVGSYAQREFQGTVSQVRMGGVNLQNVVTYAVIVGADNQRLELLPGMTASVKISTGRRDRAVRLPNEALRFKAPPSLQSGEEGIGRGGRGEGGRGRREAIIAELAETLALTEPQREALTAALPQRSGWRNRGAGEGGGGGWRNGGGENGAAASEGDERPRGGGRGGGGGGFDQMIASALEPLLTAAQKAKLEEWRTSRANFRRVQVWVLRSGTPARVRAQLGISDDRFSEVVGGDLKPGDQVITRYSEGEA